eukprot:m.744977 g.744977  ORF g.744977 m.744977 type:complete len:468 (+) comp58953_c1_seq42:980-2383(+)
MRLCVCIALLALLVPAHLQQPAGSRFFNDATNNLHIEPAAGADIYLSGTNVTEMFSKISGLLASVSSLTAQLQSAVSQGTAQQASIGALQSTVAAQDDALAQQQTTIGSLESCLTNASPIDIATLGARAFDAWELNGKQLLAVANHYGSSYSTESMIYELQAATGTPTVFQNIATLGAAMLRQFVIDGESYLAIAQYHNDFSRNISSVVLKFNGTAYALHQSIPTLGALGIAYLDDTARSGHRFLVFGNHYDGTRFVLNSEVLVWNTTAKLFEHLQFIQTNAAYAAELRVNGVAHLYLAFTGGRVSHVLRYNGTRFVVVQNVSATWSTHLKPFRIGTSEYLASGLNLTAVQVLKFNNSSQQYEQFQTIAADASHGFEAFDVGGCTYLYVSSSESGGQTALNSEILRWDATKQQFVHVQYIPTIGGLYAKFFRTGSDAFLAVPNHRNGAAWAQTSHVYKWCGTQFSLK